ncbi:type VII secretion system-associated protein [Streptomyces coelicoflavus]|uniref:type VII secretion system-associated protein n=1 Tax=Streptomyces coelicoflavus TaxID=285562 RepID=UPI002E25A881
MSNEAPAPTDTRPTDVTEPQVPDEIRKAAELAPDHWLGMVDPTWAGEGEPPKWAVLGEWRSGPDGTVEEWRPNEDYRPSPRALGWPEPTDPVDEAIQLAASGYGPGDAVPRALVTAEIAVLLAPGGGPLSAVTPNEEAVVPAFTSPQHLHTSGRFGHELMPAAEVLDMVPAGHLLYLNASGAVSMTVDLDAFRHAVEESLGEQSGTGEGEDREEGAEPPASVRPPTVDDEVPSGPGAPATGRTDTSAGGATPNDEANNPGPASGSPAGSTSATD